MTESVPVVAPAGMQQASINLTQSLHEVYEPDWHGKDDVLSIGKVRTTRNVQWDPNVVQRKRPGDP